MTDPTTAPTTAPTTDATTDAITDAGTRSTIVNPPTLPDPTPNGYSTVVVAPPGARLAHVSGQGGHDAAGAFPPDLAAQVRLAYANLRAALEGIGARPADVVKLTTYVVDHDPSKLGVLTEAVTAMFGDALPAQTLVPVPKLAIGAMLFEVDAVVALPPAPLSQVAAIR